MHFLYLAHNIEHFAIMACYDDIDGGSPYMVYGGGIQDTIRENKRKFVFLGGLVVLAIICYLIYMVIRGSASPSSTAPPQPEAPQPEAPQKITTIVPEDSRQITIAPRPIPIDALPVAQPVLVIPPAETSKPNLSMVLSDTGAVGGNMGDEDLPFEFNCPTGQFVNGLYIHAGDGVDNINFSCSGSPNRDRVRTDGAGSNRGWGGTGGNATVFTLDNGMDSAWVTGGRYIGNVTPGHFTSPQPSGGRARSPWNGALAKLNCPSGQKVVGLYGRSGQYINKLGFKCQ
jgi:hypothetical protein